MIVVYAASRNLYPYLPAAYQSLLRHNQGTEVYLFIEDDALPYRTPSCVHCVNCSKQKFFRSDGPNMKSPYTYLSLLRVCYTKLFVGEGKTVKGIKTLPKADKVIQLDVDTIVCDSLRPLWDADMGEAYFMAAEELMGSYKPYGEQYWNTGVCVCNLAAWRKDKVDDLMIKALDTKYYQQIDQDVECEIGGEDPSKFAPMHTRYNESLFTGISLSPVIVHYAGEPKRYTNPYLYRGVYQETYRKYYEEDACRKAGITF